MIAGLLIVGLLLVDTALRGTEHELAQRLQTDLLGKGGFIVWIFAILAIGAIGYIPGLETASHYLLALLMVVILLHNGGVWSEFQKAIQQAARAGPAPAVAPKPTSLDQSSGGSGSGSQSSSSSGSGGGGSSLIGLASIGAMFA